MPFCYKCGKKINDDDLFCPFCGTKAIMDAKETVSEESCVSEKIPKSAEEKPIENAEEKKPENTSSAECAAKDTGSAKADVCPFCGSAVGKDDRFCEKCGALLKKEDPKTDDERRADFGRENPDTVYPYITRREIIKKAKLKKKEEKSRAKAEKENKPKKKSKKAIWISAVCVVLAAAILVTGFWKPGFFISDTETSGNTNGNVSAGNTENAVTSKAFEINPFPGLKISAEANALDKDREFKVKKYSQKETDDFTLDTAKEGLVTFAAFDIDAGLGENTDIPGTFRVSFDMSQFDIPNELFDYMTIVRRDEDGYYRRMNTCTEGSTIYAEADRNCPFLLVGGLTLGALSVGFLLKQHYIDRGVPDQKYTSYNLKCETGTSYNLIVPSDKTQERTEEFREMCAKEKKIIESYTQEVEDSLYDSASENYLAAVAYMAALEKVKVKGVENAGPEASRALLKIVSKDKEWQKLQEEKRKPEWEKNLFPFDASVVVPRLKEADKYLFDERLFKKPTHAVDIFIFKNPKETVSNAYGHEVNLLTTRPFIKVYTNSKGFYNNKGSLLLTMTHELFHVVQNSYCFNGTDEKLPFFEATAATVENEAFEYYNRHNTCGEQINKESLTNRNFWQTYEFTFLSPNDWGIFSSNYRDNDLYLDHGYTVSHFIEFMRDKYGKNDGAKNYFMNRLMLSYKYSYQWYTALKEVTSNDEEQLMKDFEEFCKECFKNNYQEFRSSAGALKTMDGLTHLTKENTYAHCEIPKLEFSTRIRSVIYKEGKEERNFKTVIVSGKDKTYDKQIYNICANGKNIAEIRGAGCIDLGALAMFEIQEINAYLSDPWGDKYSYDILLLLPPKAPITYLENDEFVVTLPKTDNDIVAYNINFFGNVDSVCKAKQGETELRFKIDEILKSTGLKKEEISKLEVSLTQRIDRLENEKDKEPIFGPVGERRNASEKKPCIWKQTDMIVTGKAPETREESYEEQKKNSVGKVTEEYKYTVRVAYNYSPGIYEFKYDVTDFSGHTSKHEGSCKGEYCYVTEMVKPLPDILPDKDAEIVIYYHFQASERDCYGWKFPHAQSSRLYWSDSPDGISDYYYRKIEFAYNEEISGTDTAARESRIKHHYTFDPDPEGICTEGDKRYIVIAYGGYYVSYEYTYVAE